MRVLLRMLWPRCSVGFALNKLQQLIELRQFLGAALLGQRVSRMWQLSGEIGGSDGTRTRGLLRDRQAF